MRELLLLAFFAVWQLAPAPGGVIARRLLRADGTPVAGALEAPEKEVSGRVVVDGNGPPPKFSLVLVRGTDLDLTADGAQVLRIDVDPLPDGTFKMLLPEGDYRVATATGVDRNAPGIPPAYFIRSLSYGSARLPTEPMRISAAERAELHVWFGTTELDPWVTVSGRIVGSEVARGPFRVALEGSRTGTLETHVNQDGTFEFPRVLRDSSYVARVLPVNSFVQPGRIFVAKKDVDGVEIVVPRERDIVLLATVEGDGPLPAFLISLDTLTCGFVCPDPTRVRVEPDWAGVYWITLPDDGRDADISGLPFGYTVKSLTDVSSNPLQSPEFHVTFSIDQALPAARVGGRLTGLDPENRVVQLVLNGVADASRFEAPVHPDGSFQFPTIPQGIYTPTLSGDVVSDMLTPSAIVVTGLDLPDVEIAAVGRSVRAPRGVAGESRAGAIVTDLRRATREVANERAAVAGLRTIGTAQIAYFSSSGGRYGNMAQLTGAGLLNSTFGETKGGYNFFIVAIGTGYVATAIPDGLADARYAFYSTPDDVVRYSLADRLAPAGRNGDSVR